MNAPSKEYVFQNLIHANENNELGKTIKMAPAEAFQTKNAQGMINPMNHDAVARRARAFGERCKQASATH